MAVKNRPDALPDSDFKLVQAFSLARIRDDDRLAAAQQVIDRLLTRNLDRGEQEYLDALTDHVELYENATVPIRVRAITIIDALSITIIDGLSRMRMAA